MEEYHSGEEATFVVDEVEQFYTIWLRKHNINLNIRVVSYNAALSQQPFSLHNTTWTNCLPPTDQHHHQRLHRKCHRRKCLSANEDQPMDLQRRGALSQSSDEAQQAFQIYSYLQHHAEERCWPSHGFFLFLG